MGSVGDWDVCVRGTPTAREKYNNRAREAQGESQFSGARTVAQIGAWHGERDVHASGGVRGDLVPARLSSCTLTSIDQRRAREAYSERYVLKGTHSRAEGSGRVEVVGGGVSEGTAKSDGIQRRRQTVSI